MNDTACKFVASDMPRVVTGRHRPECGDELCKGCQPCTETHCVVCDRAHTPVTCAECVAATRADLHAIAKLCGSLPTEVSHRGVNGEAMMLLGPAANAEAWGYRAMSAMMGRIDASYLDDCRDEQHPLWITGYWAEKWRIHLEHHSDLDLTLERAVDYLDTQMTYMAGQEDPAFDEMASALRGCRIHLEDVLADGIREETGAPCPECKRPLVKDYGKTPVYDRWICPDKRCGEWYTASEYDKYVTDDYRSNAKALTAPDMAEEYGVPAGTVRGWATKRPGDERPKVRKRGKDSSGRQLYDVADVKAARDAIPRLKSA